MVKRYVVSAPFGNYIRFKDATSIIGPYSYFHRGGMVKRVWRVLFTVRYYNAIRAWVNKLALPCPGLAELQALDKEYCKDKIIQVVGFDRHQWTRLIDQALKRNPLAVELNISCPNVGKPSRNFHDAIEAALLFDHEKLIWKMPPIHYERMVDHLYRIGYKKFHCCNTLPTPGGGMSGKPLKELSMGAVNYVKKLSDTWVIGGGGVTSWGDVCDYNFLGADSVSVGSDLFFPWTWRKHADFASRLTAK